jgi:RNA polymerase sigma factor (sigma-70 family)
MSLEEQAFEAYRDGPSPDRLLALLKTQQDRVYNLCFQVLRHAQDAEDAAQKVLLKLVEGLGALPDAAALRRWLYRVCVTTALDVRTERSRRRAREREVALMNPIQSAPASDGEGDLLAAIGSLEEDLGDLLVRHYFEKSTLKELAAEQRVSEVAVWKRIEKGKERLRKLLSTPSSAMSMAALELRLTSIVPAKAPAAWPAAALAAKAGVPAAVGAMAVAAKAGSSAKIVAACIGLLAAGLGGAVYLGAVRTRQEPQEARDQALKPSAHRRPKDPTTGAAAAPFPTAAAPGKAPESAATTKAGPSGDAELKERLRKVIRLSLQAKGLGKPGDVPDPGLVKEVEAITDDLGPAFKDPASVPGLFAGVYRYTMEVIFEELGVPMSESQKGALLSAVGRMRAPLEECSKGPLQDYAVNELRAYRELVVGLKSLTEAQLGNLAQFTTPSEMFPISGSEIVVFNGIQESSEEVVRVWTKAYQLGDAQMSAAGTAAKTFVDAWDRIDRQFEAQYGYRPGTKPPGTPAGNFADRTGMAVDYALSTLEAERDALRLLEGALTAEQLNRLRGAPMTRFNRGTVPVGAER